MPNNLALYVPIEKIDKEKRTVAGWATSETIDKQGEIVDYAGSKEAFSNWHGNIREMHEPKAVGKAVEIIPDDDNKRIWVEAHISKGAEDTWQKVLDGTLRGYSIGGQTVSKTVQIIKDVTSNSQKTVNRILKYRLNELSLVDNPANPTCAIELVKSVDGVPYQTENVEDEKKVIITEADDPLKAEVNEHREKADSLIRKVLDSNDLDKLADDDFGVVRKFVKDGVSTRERLIPMPDKVHAARALQILEKYNLSDVEKEAVHEKARNILGSAYDTHKSLNRGGENEMKKEDFEKLADVIKSLAEKVEALEKKFEGAHRPIAGAKETPKDADTTPELGESAPEKPGAADEVQTQKPEGNYPVKDSEPEKATETGDVAKAKNPATSSLQTQKPEGAYPYKENEPEKAASAGDVKKEDVDSVVKPSAPEAGKHPATLEGPHTQPEDGAYPAKGPIKAEVEYDEEEKKEEVALKSTGKSENDLSKVLGAIESLRKRVDDIDGALRQPKPRKFKVEKNFDATTDEAAELSAKIEEVKKWNASGKPLTAEQEHIKNEVLNKMLSNKVR